MTGDEIIAQARTAFGEDTALTLTDAQMQGFLDQAIHEIYGWLPPEENRHSHTTDTLTVSPSAGDSIVPETWDKVLQVTDAVGMLTPVSSGAIANIDRLGRYIQPDVRVWSYDGERIYVRPGGPADLEVVHTEAPPLPTDYTLEITALPLYLHPSLAHLVTSLAYAQEEDAEQAALYRGYAQSALTTRLGATDGDAG